ncbi:transglutaminaseTgpA domain-containing protein [Neosynechococcus sphagnicola]|uniref:transglutaminaseTgpA domain-containing protein n=1 Tax=Neosynechococcus sphagnicola TaxID=1501145 RepID=UPI0023BA92F3|nr:transglutaminaseTgpA domain-containing protein [Neosynechococcus sphagnicola]
MCGKAQARVGGGSATSGSTASGQVDDTFYYGFNSRINQNLRGQMKPKIVLRVRSQAPGFWRVLAFDHYTGQGWEVSRNDHSLKLERNNWSYQYFLPIPGSLTRTQEIVQTYTVVSELPNLIPALYRAERLFFPTRQIAIDPEGSLRAPIGLSEDLTYTVISRVPYRDRQVLRQAPTTYSESIQRYYLEVPSAIAQKLRPLAEAWLAKSPQPLTSPYEQALYLTQYLKQHYTVQPELPFLAAQQDLVDAFLFQFQGGYPDHFSTVLTLLLRSIEIPARLVVGFGAGQFNPFTGFYVVRNTDAYALTEVYFPQNGWFTFDPIPGHDLLPPSVEENATFGILRQFWNWVAGWIPSPVSGWIAQVVGGIAGWIFGLITGFLLLFTRGWVGIIVGSLVVVTLSFAGWLGWNQWQNWRYHRWLSQLPPMEGLYQQMLGWLDRQGIRKHPAQTPGEFGHTVQASVPQGKVVNDIAQAYVRWRYGSLTPPLGDLKQRFRNLQRSRRFKAQSQRRRSPPASLPSPNSVADAAKRVVYSGT